MNFDRLIEAVKRIYMFLFLGLVMALLLLRCNDVVQKKETSELFDRWEVLEIDGSNSMLGSDRIHLLNINGDGSLRMDSWINFYRGSLTFIETNKIKFNFNDQTSACCDTTFTKRILSGLSDTIKYFVINDTLSLTNQLHTITARRLPKCMSTSNLCTENYWHIYVSVVHSDGTPVELTDWSVIRVIDSKNMTPLTDGFPPYMLVSDRNKESLFGKDVEVQFQGKVNEKIVVQRNYVIGSDCCHVRLVSGDLKIVL